MPFVRQPHSPIRTLGDPAEINPFTKAGVS